MKTIIIRYPFNWGGKIQDRRFWEARIEGDSDIWDYDSKENLKRKAEEKGYNWKVLRYHKNGEISVVEQYPVKKKQFSITTYRKGMGEYDKGLSKGISGYRRKQGEYDSKSKEKKK